MNMTSMQTNRSVSPKTAKGFTLVEVIIVVLILSVLAAIAYPAYQDSVVKARRNAAKACVMEASQFLERFYTTNLTYVGAAFPGCNAGTDVTNHYTVTPVIAGARAYTVTATPRALQLVKDTQCGTLSLNNTGVKTKTGTESLDYCW
jgi:type IV pilus assembly protein PilE